MVRWWKQGIIVVVSLYVCITYVGSIVLSKNDAMLPNIKENDLVYVSKWTYFDSPIMKVVEDRQEERLPEYGSIVYYTVGNQKMFGRVVGLPGDRIYYTSGRLVFNNNLMNRNYRYQFPYYRDGGYFRFQEYFESTPNNQLNYRILERDDTSLSDNTVEYIVANHSVFVLGDNRDFAIDSRYTTVSSVPIKNIIGDAKRVIFSFNGCTESEYVICPGGNWVSSLFRKL